MTELGHLCRPELTAERARSLGHKLVRMLGLRAVRIGKPWAVKRIAAVNALESMFAEAEVSALAPRQEIRHAGTSIADRRRRRQRNDILRAVAEGRAAPRAAAHV